MFVVSPDFLEPIYKESAGYTFKIQGYGNFQDACKGLLKTNVQDIIGFLILAEKLPEDLSYFEKFLEYCNLVSDVSKRIVIALQNNTGFNQLILRIKPKNIKVSLISNYEVVSDTFIKKTLFGTILKDSLKPYKVLSDDIIDINRFTEKISIKYTPLFHSYTFKCIEPILNYSSLEEALSVDKNLRELEKFDDILYELRLVYLYKKFNMEYKVSYDLDSMILSNSQYCVYKSIEAIIDETYGG